MPYRLSGKCVQKQEEGRWKNVKCHPTRAEALAHLRALEVNVSEQMLEGVRQWVEEAGGSLDDKVWKVRRAFHKWYNDGLAWERMVWPLDVFEDYLMVSYGEQIYRVDYTVAADGSVTFADTPWPLYELRYVPAGEGDAAAGDAGVETEDNPVTEAASVREAVNLTVHLAEVSKDKEGLYPDSIIVVEGRSANDNEYTQSALETGITIFEGARLVADHEIEEGDLARPEGSVHDVIGKVTNVRMGEADGKNCLVGDVYISKSEEKIRTKVAEGILGDLSIRAWGSGQRADDGHFVVESFQQHPYTNIAMVTVGAAGGKLVSESQHAPEPDADEGDETQPVSEASRREVRALRESESDMAVQEQLTEALSERDHLLEENTQLFHDMRTMQAEAQIAEAVVKASKLPAATLHRIAERAGVLKEAFATHGNPQTVEQFRDVVDGLIEAERDYLAQITPNGNVTGLTRQGGEDVEKILAEAFKDIVPAGAVGIAVRGRQ
jgi:hypothetical protein